MRRTLLDRSPGAREPLLVVPHDASPELRAMAIHEGGWVCDGEADQEEINAALSGAARKGGRVLCAAGTYRITAPILVPSNVELQFAQGNRVTIPETHNFGQAGNRVTVWQEPFCAIVRNLHAGDGESGDEGIVLDGMHLDVGAPTGSTKLPLDVSTGGILLDGCADSRIVNCTVKDVCYDVSGSIRAYGIALTRCTDCAISGCRTDGSGYEGIGLRSGNKRCTVSGCVGENNKIHFVQAARWVGQTHYGEGIQEDLLIEDCRSLTNGIIMHGRGLSPVSRSVIANCRTKWITLDGLIDNCGVTANACRQIAVNSSEASMSGVNVSNNALIMEDGVPKASTGIFLDAYADGGVSKNILIANNTIAGGNIIMYQREGKSAVYENVTIQGNVVTYDSTGTLTPRLIDLGLYGSGTIKQVAILNNRLAGLHQLVPLDYDDTGVYILLASGSTVNIQDLLVQNNNIYARYGVRCVTDGAGTITNMLAIGNMFNLLSDVIYLTNTIKRLAILNNFIQDCTRVVRGPADDVIIHGNVLVDVRVALFNSATNIAVGINMSWKDGVGWNGAWRFKQDDSDADTMYIQKLIDGAWTTAGTFDASPPP